MSKQPSKVSGANVNTKIDVVTNLSNEDIKGMANPKARKLAMYIANARRDIHTRSSDVTATTQSQRATSLQMYQAIQNNKLPQKYSVAEASSVSALWRGSVVKSNQRKKRCNKPMSNQQARAIVQRDFYLSRSNNSQL